MACLEATQRADSTAKTSALEEDGKSLQEVENSIDELEGSVSSQPMPIFMLSVPASLRDLLV